MDLVGLLSNRETTILYQGLTSRNWKQASERRALSRGVAPDGRRKFGVIRDAIVAVLKEADGDLRVRDVHLRVEELLGESVSRGSVKSYLRMGCRQKRPLFEYAGRQGYRLAAWLNE